MPVLLEIVTPDGAVLSQTVDSVSLPTTQGIIEVLPGHIALAAALEPGELYVHAKGTSTGIAISQGFVLVNSDQVSVVVEGAIHFANIDPSTLQAAQERAKQALQDARSSSSIDHMEVQRLESLVRYIQVQYQAKKKSV